MRWFTHISFSFLLFLIINEIMNIESGVLALIYLLFCILGSISPDLDLKIKFISKHRGIIHSFLGLLLISLPIILLSLIVREYFILLFFSVGYISHLFLDSFTFSGVRWFPFTEKSKGKLKTGGLKEMIFSTFIWFLILFFIFRGP